jgi:hypothetical protein
MVLQLKPSADRAQLADKLLQLTPSHLLFLKLHTLQVEVDGTIVQHSIQRSGPNHVELASHRQQTSTSSTATRSCSSGSGSNISGDSDGSSDDSDGSGSSGSSGSRAISSSGSSSTLSRFLVVEHTISMPASAQDGHHLQHHRHGLPPRPPRRRRAR